VANVDCCGRRPHRKNNLSVKKSQQQKPTPDGVGLSF
jgi:hypothetical protein